MKFRFIIGVPDPLKIYNNIYKLDQVCTCDITRMVRGALKHPGLAGEESVSDQWCFDDEIHRFPINLVGLLYVKPSQTCLGPRPYSKPFAIQLQKCFLQAFGFLQAV